MGGNPIQFDYTVIFALLINSETPTSLSGCSLFYFGGGRIPYRSLDVQL